MRRGSPALVVLALIGSISCSRKSTPEVSKYEQPSEARETGPVQERAASTEVHHEDRSGAVLELGEDALRDLRLTTLKAEKRPAGETIVVSGSLEIDPARTFAVSTPVAARVKSLRRAMGERVPEREELVVLESSELGRARAAVAASKARVDVARARSKLAEEQRTRVRELAADKMTTVREVQAAEAEAAARSAEVAEAEVASQDAARLLTLLPGDPDGVDAAFTLRSPSDGVVTFRDGSSGETVEAGHVFYRIADLGVLQATVHPFERDAVRIGETAQVRLYAAAHPGKSFAASYLRGGPEVDRESRTLPVRLSVPNAEGTLLPGMSVTAEIRLQDQAGEEIVSVPIAAVQRIERDWCVFLPLGEGRFERRVIARGRDLGGEVEILSGLAAGEEVVVEGAFVLRSESVRGAGEGEEHEH
jgi:cobalt-zinc-cadmium efflux system membrane fusion protein